MFWRRRAPAPSESAYPVNDKVSRLGIERRRHARIRYPAQKLTTLPTVYYGPHMLRVHDVSIGGLCLLDAQDILGPNAGNNVELHLVWPDCKRLVKCRMVSRVHDRRHIEFIDLGDERTAVLKAAIRPGVAGLSMKPIFQVPKNSVQLEALEAWTSIQCDALTFFSDVHIEAEITIDDQTYRLFKNAWPMTPESTPATVREVEHILIFLGNIPQPSPRVSGLLNWLSEIYFEART